jgi:hypothetical protein
MAAIVKVNECEGKEVRLTEGLKQIHFRKGNSKQRRWRAIIRHDSNGGFADSYETFPERLQIIFTPGAALEFCEKQIKGSGPTEVFIETDAEVRFRTAP